MFGAGSFTSFRRRFGYHRDVSYALALFLMLGIGVGLASVTMPADAANMATTCNDWGNELLHTCSNVGSIAVNAVVPPQRPSTPATITSPTNGQTFSTNPITVLGTCPKGYLIKVFSNGILIGSVICGPNDQFSVPADLVIGQNALTAVPYNTLDQSGPTSNTVNVTLNQPPGGLGFSTELILQSVNYYRGILPGQQVTWPITIVGGQAPYAVSIDWGDGTNEVLTRLTAGPFTVSHVYKNVGTGYLGTYPLIIRATDSVGHNAYLQLTTLVNAATGVNNSGSTSSGSGSGSGSGKTTSSTLSKLIVIWPLWIVIILMIISFWLGERREKHIMRKQLAALA